MIKLKRVCDAREPADGKRILVDRLWLRGVKKDSLSLAAWMKPVSPSDSLRRWFGHDPEKWTEFQRRYLAELQRNPKAWRPILEAARKGPVTLLFGARDSQHNNGVALGILSRKASVVSLK